MGNKLELLDRRELFKLGQDIQGRILYKILSQNKGLIIIIHFLGYYITVIIVHHIGVYIYKNSETKK